jgi:hypothetical protein
MQHRGRTRKPPTVTIRLDERLTKRLRFIAAAHGLDMSDYLAQVLEPIAALGLQKLDRASS